MYTVLYVKYIWIELEEYKEHPDAMHWEEQDITYAIFLLKCLTWMESGSRKQTNSTGEAF